MFKSKQFLYKHVTLRRVFVFKIWYFVSHVIYIEAIPVLCAGVILQFIYFLFLRQKKKKKKEKRKKKKLQLTIAIWPLVGYNCSSPDFT